MKPIIGDNVTILHRSEEQPNGMVKIITAPRRQTTVTKVYSDGAVRCANGDVWTVKRLSGGWVTTSKQSRV